MFEQDYLHERYTCNLYEKHTVYQNLKREAYDMRSHSMKCFILKLWTNINRSYKNLNLTCTCTPPLNESIRSPPLNVFNEDLLRNIYILSRAFIKRVTVGLLTSFNNNLLWYLCEINSAFFLKVGSFRPFCDLLSSVTKSSSSSSHFN